MRNNALNAYRQTKVKTASQGQLIVMLYDEAIKQMDLSIELMELKKVPLDKVNNAILKTQDVITELMVALDFEKGGEIANNLLNLYMFFNQELINANMSKDTQIIKNVRKMVVDLRGAWAQIAGKTEESARQVTGGVNIAG